MTIKTNAILIALLFMGQGIYANTDMTSSVKKQDSETKTERESTQMNLQQSISITNTKNIGDEKSQSDTITKTLSETRTATQSVTRTQSGVWKVDLNPVVYFLKQLKQMGWPKEAFYLSPDKVGTSAFIDKNQRIINLNKKQAIDDSASIHGFLTEAQSKKVKESIQILYTTSILLETAINSFNPNNSITFK